VVGNRLIVTVNRRIDRVRREEVLAEPKSKSTKETKLEEDNMMIEN